MSYYDGPHWHASGQNSWDSQGAGAPVRAGASGPQPQDDYAFSYQFDEVDRAYENLQKSGKGYGAGGRHARIAHGCGPRPHLMNNYEDARSHQGPNLHTFYAAQRHQPSRGSNEAEQIMQAKRRMAAQRERELRNLHTEQQYQRNVLSEVPQHGGKHMSEEETRELIARQRSALYSEGPFAEKSGYVDESGNIRSGPSGPGVPVSLRGPSPLTFDGIGRVPAGTDAPTPGPVNDHNAVSADPSPRPKSTISPQASGPNNKVFENAVGNQSRTSTSSPTDGSSPRDLVPGSKAGSGGASVAPIGTRPSGTPSTTASGKRSTTPMASSSGWGRGSGVWGQSSGLGAQASVWG